MTDPIPTTPAASAAPGAPRARHSWATPALARLASRNAENGPNPVATDGSFTPS